VDDQPPPPTSAGAKFVVFRFAMEDPEVALADALQWIAAEPDCADAHYEAALAYEDLEREAERCREMLTVLSLDSRSTAGPLPGCDEIIGDEVEETLAELPPAFTDRLGPVTILVEPRPSRELVESGVDARILGLFEGATSEELSSTDAPLTTTRILIFSHNLRAAFEDEAKLREEVRITVLHEIGHFFGLEEEDMERLGLE
jgi:predicted Zn-dependent protease with MMP-like domain